MSNKSLIHTVEKIRKKLHRILFYNAPSPHFDFSEIIELDMIKFISDVVFISHNYPNYLKKITEFMCTSPRLSFNFNIPLYKHPGKCLLSEIIKTWNKIDIKIKRKFIIVRTPESHY